ncbi:MAG TPA: ArsC family reductase [Rhodocyclaceae bacterium]|jgi:Spx/MgsR family transcriptional regulator|nr:ArsC family reductase [Rhodocyclaceae bacterium]
MSNIHIYGIKNCDTMKKAMAWLSARDIPHEFHDYKKEGVDEKRLIEWCKTAGWKALVNTKGTTWRKFTPEQQAISNQMQAVALMLENPSLIRRPVVETGNELLIGFDPMMFESKLV